MPGAQRIDSAAGRPHYCLSGTLANMEQRNFLGFLTGTKPEGNTGFT